MSQRFPPDPFPGDHPAPFFTVPRGPDSYVDAVDRAPASPFAPQFPPFPVPPNGPALPGSAQAYRQNVRPMIPVGAVYPAPTADITFPNGVPPGFFTDPSQAPQPNGQGPYIQKAYAQGIQGSPLVSPVSLPGGVPSLPVSLQGHPTINAVPVIHLVPGTTIGNSVVLAPTASVNFSLLLIGGVAFSVRGDLIRLEQHEANPLPITVGFDVQVSPANQVNVDIVSWGLIQYGSGGYQSAAMFDLRRGTVVSVNASFVQVAALVPVLAGEYSAAASLRIAAWGAIGTRPSGRAHQVTFSRNQTGLAVGADSGNFLIPQLASSVTLLRAPANNTNIRIDFVDAAGLVRAQAYAPAGDTPQSIPVGQWVLLNLHNDGPAAITNAELVFDIDL